MHRLLWNHADNCAQISIDVNPAFHYFRLALKRWIQGCESWLRTLGWISNFFVVILRRTLNRCPSKVGIWIPDNLVSGVWMFSIQIPDKSFKYSNNKPLISRQNVTFLCLQSTLLNKLWQITRSAIAIR